MLKQIIEHCQRVMVLEKRNAAILKELSVPVVAERRATLYGRYQANKEEIEAERHELHCLAVVEGFADYNANRYGRQQIPGPVAEVYVYRRDPLPQLTEKVDPMEHAPKDAKEAIKKERIRLETAVIVENGRYQAGMENDHFRALQELEEFNRLYPPTNTTNA